MTYTINHERLLESLRACMARGHSVLEISQNSDVNKDVVYDILKGKERKAQLGTIKKLCEYLDIDPEQIIITK